MTGGAGFIGSAVVRLAISRGHSVVNVDSLTYAANLENVKSVSDNINYFFEKVDIRSRKELDRVFNQYKPDAVMHLAAESHVDRSIDGPDKFIETNVNGTLNMLEAARNYWFAHDCFDNFRFHHVSTDEVFGSLPNDRDIKFTEETPYDPRSPYAASKASADHLVSAWHNTYQLPVVMSNCSNNYGPYHFPEKLIPVVIINALSGKPLPIYGNGSHIRDWLYVDDHANALMLVLEKGEVGRRYNIGGDGELTNLELVEILCAILDELHPNHEASYRNLIKFVKDRPGHDYRYAIDSSRIRDELGWIPSVAVEEGLKKTALWFLHNKDWWQPLLSGDGIGRRLGSVG